LSVKLESAKRSAQEGAQAQDSKKNEAHLPREVIRDVVGAMHLLILEYVLGQVARKTRQDCSGWRKLGKRPP